MRIQGYVFVCLALMISPVHRVVGKDRVVADQDHLSVQKKESVKGQDGSEKSKKPCLSITGRIYDFAYGYFKRTQYYIVNQFPGFSYWLLNSWIGKKWYGESKGYIGGLVYDGDLKTPPKMTVIMLHGCPGNGGEYSDLIKKIE